MHYYYAKNNKARENCPENIVDQLSVEESVGVSTSKALNLKLRIILLDCEQLVVKLYLPVGNPVFLVWCPVS